MVATNPPTAAQSVEADYKSAQRYVDRLLSAGTSAPLSAELQLPPWFDAQRFRCAQLLYRRNVYAHLLGTMVGMLSIFALPSILNVLRFTKQSDTAQLSYRRYLATMYHITLWLQGDLQPGTKSWKSFEQVRKRHLLVSRHTEKAESRIIAQGDIALVQFGLIGYTVSQPKLFGFAATPQEFDDVVYVWRVIGYMLGVGDEYNLFCDSRPENYARMALIQEQVFRPSMSEADCPDFHRLVDTLVGGLSAYNSLLSTASFLHFARMVNGCAGCTGYWEGQDAGQLAKMSWWDRWLLWQQMLVHRFVVTNSVGRAMLAVWVRGMYVMVTYVPVLAVWRFGWGKNLVRIMKGVRG